MCRRRGRPSAFANTQSLDQVEDRLLDGRAGDVLELTRLSDVLVCVVAAVIVEHPPPVPNSQTTAEPIPERAFVATVPTRRGEGLRPLLNPATCTTTYSVRYIQRFLTLFRPS